MVRKTIDLSEEKEPDIFGAIKGPAGLLENVAVDDLFRPDYSDTSKTANGRANWFTDYNISHDIYPCWSRPRAVTCLRASSTASAVTDSECAMDRLTSSFSAAVKFMP